MKEILKRKYQKKDISPEKRQKTIHYPRLISQYNNRISNINKFVQ